MIRDFQRILTRSKFTLPIVGLLAVLCWWHGADMPADSGVADDGSGWLWNVVPEVFSGGWTGLCVGGMMAAAMVFLLMELNNSNVLLRVGSRMMGVLLTVLFAVSFSLHVFCVGHVVGLLGLLSYFCAFASYQNGGRVYVFVNFLCLSLASLFFPPFIFFVPLCWASLALLRSFDLKSFCASLLGVITPYWCLLAYMVLFDRYDIIVDYADVIDGLDWFAYSSLSLHQMLVGILSLVMFVVGGIEFRVHSYLDKTRIRILYDVVLVLGCGGFLLLGVLPGCYRSLLPFVLVNVAIVSGHHLAQCFGKVMNVYTLLLLLALVGMIVEL